MIRHRALAAIVAGALAGASCAERELGVTDAWIPLAPPGTTAHVAYLVIHNPRDAAVELTEARSSSFAHVEFHATTQTDGGMEMHRLASLTVPAHGELRFAPGALHLMLFEARAEPHAGDAIHLVLRFADGTELGCDAQVRDARVAQAPHRH